MYGGILPTHVAMACVDYIPRDRECVLDRIREQFWSDRWRDWTADLQVKVRSQISRELCECNGTCRSMCGCHNCDVVGYATDGGGHKETEACKDTGGEEQHGCFA